MSPLRRVWHSSWRGRLLIIGPYVFVVLVGFLGFRDIESQAHQRCLDRQTDREVLRTVVDIATQPSGVTLDLTQVPGFNELDPNTQAWVRNLSAEISGTPPPSRRSLHDQLLSKLPPIDC